MFKEFEYELIDIDDNGDALIEAPSAAVEKKTPKKKKKNVEKTGSSSNSGTSLKVVMGRGVGREAINVQIK